MIKKYLSKIVKKFLDRKIFMIGNSHLINIRQQYNLINNINDLDYKIFSQNGEDGIIDYLLTILEIKKPKFVEIGIGNYSECNTRFIYERCSPEGLVIDYIEDLEKKVADNILLWKGDLKIINKRINSKNILEILMQNNFLNNLDLFVLDIDSIDYWILEKMPKKFCKIAVVEYNSTFGSDIEVTVPNLDNFNRTVYHYSNLCFGASLKAIINLMKNKGLTFIGTDITRTNAFFIQNKYIRFLSFNIPDSSSLFIYTECNLRESRNINNKLSFKSGNDKIKEIYDCEVFDIQNKEIKKLKNFFL